MKKLALILCIAFAALALITWLNAPQGTRWLGDGIQNSSDIAVYLSYLRQGHDRNLLLKDLYAIETHTPRFDLFWSLLGLTARNDLSLILVHETARALGIIFLVVVLWYVIQNHLRTSTFQRKSEEKRNTKLAVLLAIGGIATGWMYTVWLQLQHAWTPTTYAAPDLVTEFALGPILFGGAHGIFAIGLLILSLHLLWSGVEEMDRRHLFLGGLSSALLFSFHPYSIPTVGLFCICSCVLNWRFIHQLTPKKYISLGVTAFIMSLPCFYYMWLIVDPVFGKHHLADNVLPLQHWSVWLITLLPFFIAAGWMWKKQLLPKKWNWTSLWLICGLFLTLFLPVPWRRKLTEGLLVPLVLLTLPAWLAIATWIRKIQPTFMRYLIGSLLVFAAWFGPIQLYLSQLRLIQSPSFQHYFYAPVEIFHATDWISAHVQSSGILLSDDRWINVWLPALTGRRVWIGHDHETPHFETKLQQYNELLTTTDPQAAQTMLADSGVQYFLTTSPSSTARFSSLLQPSWKNISHDRSITVWGHDF